MGWERTTTVGASLIVCGLALSACTSGSSGSAAAAASGSASRSGGPPPTTLVDPRVQTVSITATDNLTFTPATITVSPGAVRLMVTVRGKLPQNVSLPGLDVNSGLLAAGATTPVDFIAPKRGKYRFYSAFHQQQGMKGTLVVK